MSILENIRKQLNWSQVKMAAALKLPISTYHCYENKVRIPGGVACDKINKFLKAHPEINYTITDILKECGDKK